MHRKTISWSVENLEGEKRIVDTCLFIVILDVHTEIHNSIWDRRRLIVEHSSTLEMLQRSIKCISVFAGRDNSLVIPFSADTRWEKALLEWVPRWHVRFVSGWVKRRMNIQSGIWSQKRRPRRSWRSNGIRRFISWKNRSLRMIHLQKMNSEENFLKDSSKQSRWCNQEETYSSIDHSMDWTQKTVHTLEFVWHREDNGVLQNSLHRFEKQQRSRSCMTTFVLTIFVVWHVDVINEKCSCYRLEGSRFVLLEKNIRNWPTQVKESYVSVRGWSRLLPSTVNSSFFFRISYSQSIPIRFSVKLQIRVSSIEVRSLEFK